MPVEPQDFPILLIDTSSRRTWAGIKLSHDQLISESTDEEASNGLFPILHQLLNQTDLKIENLASIAFCEGPGSMLGIRTAIMAIRAWQGAGLAEGAKLFGYNCLALGCLIAQQNGLSTSDAIIVTDARRNSWNATRAPETRPSILSNEELEASEATILTLDAFPSWTKTQAQLNPIPYCPKTVFSDRLGLEILSEREIATPLLLRESEYKKWIPRFKPKETPSQ